MGSKSSFAHGVLASLAKVCFPLAPRWIPWRRSVKRLLVSFFAVVLLILQYPTIPNQSLRAEPPAKPRPIGSQFFGMITHQVDHWPTLQIGAVRLWNTGTTWPALNPSEGTYNWVRLDKWLSAARQHRVTQIMLTLAMTPQWASSNPGDPICSYGPGQCDPPNDLNPDGSGTDQHWKDFVRKRLTNTPVRQAGSVLKCPDDHKNRVVSTQATYPCGSSAVGGRVCEQQYAAERVLPQSAVELRYAESAPEGATRKDSPNRDHWLAFRRLESPLF